MQQDAKEPDMEEEDYRDHQLDSHRGLRGGGSKTDRAWVGSESIYHHHHLGNGGSLLGRLRLRSARQRGNEFRGRVLTGSDAGCSLSTVPLRLDSTTNSLTSEREGAMENEYSSE